MDRLRALPKYARIKPEPNVDALHTVWLQFLIVSRAAEN